jgi:hypothetical protein
MRRPTTRAPRQARTALVLPPTPDLEQFAQTAMSLGGYTSEERLTIRMERIVESKQRYVARRASYGEHTAYVEQASEEVAVIALAILVIRGEITLPERD